MFEIELKRRIFLLQISEISLEITSKLALKLLLKQLLPFAVHLLRDKKGIVRLEIRTVKMPDGIGIMKANGIRSRNDGADQLLFHCLFVFQQVFVIKCGK